MMGLNARSLVLSLVAFAAFALPSCGADTPPPKAPETATPAPAASTRNRLPEKAPDSPTASAVRISDDDYNMTLGQSRAASVATYLVHNGMQKEKTESTSRGAMDAIGTDEPTWARDRRVDMILAQ